MDLDFPNIVLDEAGLIKPQFENIQSRNQVEGITIDGPNSRDLDDAIFLEYFPDKFIIHVSIADVSEYILPGSLLFKEALKRVSTKYLAKSNIPMLPVSISEDSLSLLDQQKRPALTFSITLTRELEIVNTEISKTILMNRRQLNYAQVDYIIDTCPDDPDYQMLNDCYILARRLMDKRRKQGALVIFDLQHLLFTNEEGHLIKMNEDDAHKSNIIIQEFMILANAAAARLAAEKDYIFLFRNHTARQTTPKREEILEQLKTAVSNARLFDALATRSGFWFNKAKYESCIKGHYGLNLPAYTHVTSPLRRISDLINHILLKAQLFNNAAPFNSEELNLMASEINSFLINSAHEKKIFFKGKSIQQTKAQIAIIEKEKLLNFSNKELKKILKEVCISRLLPDELNNILLQRFNDKKIGVEHLAIILFDSGDYDEKWKDLRKKALETAVTIPGFSLQILNIKSQSGFFSNFKIEVVENNGLFTARVVAGINEKELSTEFYAYGSNKKEAQQSASNEFLSGYFSSKLVSPNDTKTPENFGKTLPGEFKLISEEEIPEENYVGQLNDLCSSRKFPNPIYEFTQTGPTHAQTFNCSCTITIGENKEQTTAFSNSKKKAKQCAAKIMFDLILEYSINKLTENVLDNKALDVKETVEENYVGKLIELCTKSLWSNPVFQFSQSGTLHQPIFMCKVHVNTSDGVVFATGNASNKRTAKQISAQRLLEQWNDGVKE